MSIKTSAKKSMCIKKAVRLTDLKWLNLFNIEVVDFVEMELTRGKRLVSQDRLRSREQLVIQPAQSRSRLFPKPGLCQRASAHQDQGYVSLRILAPYAIEKTIERTESRRRHISFLQSLAEDGEAAHIPHPSGGAP